MELTLAEMVVPQPVVEVSLTLEKGKPERLYRALGRFVREDPSLQSFTDAETGELRLRGMGELHLEIYADRLREEFDCEVTLGRPEVAHRQTLSARVDFDHLHRKQNGGNGEYARIIGYLEPSEEETFRWEVARGEIPTIYREGIRRSFMTALKEQLAQPMIGVCVVITGGDSHSKDSSDLAFSVAVREALRQAVAKSRPVILEPIMRVEAEVDASRNGAMLRTMMSRRGRILFTAVSGDIARAAADIPLVEMFGYAGALQSATSGSGSFTMRFERFEPRG